MTLDSHPLRNRIVSEMHMRRMPSLAAPVTMTQTVRLVTAEDRDNERAHIAAMPGVAADALIVRDRDAAGRTSDGVELLWERHNEASTTTVIAPSHEKSPFLADQVAQAGVAWLEGRPVGSSGQHVSPS